MNVSKQFIKIFYSTNVMIIKAKILFDFWILIFKITGKFLSFTIDNACTSTLTRQDIYFLGNE